MSLRFVKEMLDQSTSAKVREELENPSLSANKKGPSRAFLFSRSPNEKPGGLPPGFQGYYQ